MKKKETVLAYSLLEGLDRIIFKNYTASLVLIAIASLACTLINYDIKITTANDDALYIESAYKYSIGFFDYFHIANAPLYPILLSPIIYLFGINLPIIKAVSVVFSVLSLFIIGKLLKNRIPPTVTFVTLLSFYCSYYYVYYSVQAYSEGLFLLVQSSFLGISFLIIDKASNENSAKIKDWLILGLIATLLSITRSIASALIIVPIIFFLINRNYKYAAYSLFSFVGFRVAYEVLKGILWGNINQFTNQGQIILQKHPYDASQGMEDLPGFIGRFFDNSNIYLSTKLFESLGLRKIDSTISEPLTIFVYCLLSISTYFIWKSKNKYLQFVSIYLIAFMGLTFIALQAFWGQHRFIMVMLPFILLVVLSGLYYMFSSPRLRSYQIFYIFLLIPVVVSPIKQTTTKGVKNIPILKKNLKGDLYAGYTPDWINYLKMSKWCGDSLTNENVACRKAPMSFVYSNGKEFVPIYNVPYSDADSLMAFLQNSKVDYIIDARLRLNPKVNNGEYVNTITRILSIIYQKYNTAFSIRNEIGANTNEPAILYKVNYSDYEQKIRK